MRNIDFLLLLMVLAACGKPMDPVAIKPTVDRFKDPVCSMWVEKKNDLYPLLYDGVLYYFCCNECAMTFSKNIEKYAYKCDCKKTGHRSDLFPEDRNCKCDHCAGKQVPCDCK